MVEKYNPPIAPTVAKVLDAFLEALEGDEDIDNTAAERLYALMREGRELKQDDINEALFPPSDNKA